MAKITYNDKTQLEAYDVKKFNAADANEIKRIVNLKADITQIGTGIKGVATPTTTAPVTPVEGDVWLVDSTTLGGTFVGFGNVVVPKMVGIEYVSNARFIRNNSAWLLQYELVSTSVAAKMELWTAKAYSIGQQVNYNGVLYEAVTVTTAAQVPSVVSETVWKPITYSQLDLSESLQTFKTTQEHIRGNTEILGNTADSTFNGAGFYLIASQDLTFSAINTAVSVLTATAAVTVSVYKGDVLTPNTALLTLLESKAYNSGQYNSIAGTIQRINLSKEYSIKQGEYLYVFIESATKLRTPYFNVDSTEPIRQRFFYKNTTAANWTGSGATYYSVGFSVGYADSGTKKRILSLTDRITTLDKNFVPVGSYYLFDSTVANTTANTMRLAVRGLYIKGGAVGQTFVISALLRHYNSTNLWRVIINDATTNTTVANYQTAIDPSSGDYQIVEIPQTNNSGISGRISIKWENLPDPFNALNMAGDSYKLHAGVQDSVNNILSPTSNQGVVGEISKRVSAIESSIDGIISTVSVVWSIPKNIYICVGREKSIYFDAVARINDNASDISIDCFTSVVKGVNDGRRWSLNPVTGDIGTFQVTFFAVDGQYKEISRKTVTVNVIAFSALPSLKNLLFIGDSITEYKNLAYWTSQVFLAAGGTQPAFIGRSIAPHAEVKHEGYSGISLGSFLNGSSPFYNATTGQIDIANYKTSKGISALHAVHLMVGFNDAIYNSLTDYSPASYMTQLANLINFFKVADPNIVFIISLTTLQSSSTNAVVNSERNKSGTFRNIWKIREAVIAAYDTVTVAGVFVADTGIVIDRYYGYPRAIRTVGVNYTDTETFVTDATHPTEEGIKQIADGIYPLLIKNLI